MPQQAFGPRDADALQEDRRVVQLDRPVARRHRVSCIDDRQIDVVSRGDPIEERRPMGVGSGETTTTRVMTSASG